MYRKTIIAIVATANAIRIESEAETEFIPGLDKIPVLGDVVEHIGNVGENLYNSGAAVWDYVSSGDGLTSDL